MGFSRRNIIRILAVSSLGFVQVKALDPPKEEAGEVDHVLVGTKLNFDEALLETKYNLVEFYAPWCGHCKALAQPYKEAAAILKEKGSDIKLIKVDATDEAELADRFQIQGYPTLLWFVSGIQSEYEGPRTAQGIVDWVEEHMQPSLKESTAEEAKEAVDKRVPSEGLFVFEGDDLMKTVAADVAEEVRGLGASYFVTGSTNKITVYTGQDESEEYESLGDLKEKDEEMKKDMASWIKKARVPAFGQITEDNYEIYVDVARNGMFWVCLEPESLESELKKYAPVFKGAAEELAKSSEGDKDVYPFVWIDAKEFEAHAKEELGCTSFPTIVLQRGDLLGDAETTKVDKFLKSFSDVSKSGELDQAAVVKFFADVKSGALAPVEEPDELDEMDDDDEEKEDKEEDLDELDDKDAEL